MPPFSIIVGAYCSVENTTGKEATDVIGKEVTDVIDKEVTDGGW